MNFILKVPKKTFKKTLLPLRIASLSSLESPNHYILQNPLISGSKGGSLQKTTYNHFESPMCTVPRSPMCTVPKSRMCILHKIFGEIEFIMLCGHVHS